MKKEKLMVMINLSILALLIMIVGDLKIENERLRRKIATVNGIIIEQQAFIRNQRNVDQDLLDMINLHSEQLGLIWERIP